MTTQPAGTVLETVPHADTEAFSLQLAQVGSSGVGQPVPLPSAAQIAAIPVSGGQTIELPVDSAGGLLAKIGSEGNLAIVIDGRTIILQGYVQAVEQAPVTIVTRGGDPISIADVIAATDPSLDIVTAAGPGSGPGPSGDVAGNGIFVPFSPGGGLGGLNAAGTLGPTALSYGLIDDERRLFTRDDDDDERGGEGGPDDDLPPNFSVSFDLLGGIVNEDDLPVQLPQQQRFSAFLVSDDGAGNDAFDTKDHENQSGTPDDLDNVDNNGNNVDDDPEPVFSVFTLTVDFDGKTPGTLALDPSTLPVGLTSEGEKIIYREQAAGGGAGNGIVAFVDNDNSGDFDPGDRLIFDIKVQEGSSDSAFTVKFTLHDNIDHAAPDLNGDGFPDLLSATEDLLALPIKLTATSSEGQESSGVLNLRVQDDIPAFGEVIDGPNGKEITPTFVGIVHDETGGVDGDADDQLPGDHTALIDDLMDKAASFGFLLPAIGEPGALLGIAQKQIAVSFGADGPSVGSGRESVFGAVSGFSENERAFELFMIQRSKGTTPAEDNKATPAVEGNLTTDPFKTNATATVNGEICQVCLRQLDAQTIIGFVSFEEGDPITAFILSIDDQGVLTLVQFHQIDHPNGGVTPEAQDDSFIILGTDGITPLVYVRASDADGDHAIAPVRIEIQDDGPLALDDVDAVDEGIATGNVVTGTDALNAVKDGNAIDGVADTPGVDTPYTISKLEHAGQTYTLVDNGDGTFSAEKNGGPLGAGESFDGAKLTVPTAEGGTFEIVLVSPIQENVGNYKYTAPEEVGPSTSFTAGATDLANSIALATAGVSAFADAFSSHGVTLTPIGGALSVKTVNVVPKGGSLGPEDYGGIGVSSTPGEETEVDNNGPDEQMQLGFATPTDNARITFGAFFDGQQFDSGNQEIVRWEAYDGATLVASGLVLGVNNGLAILDIDTDGQTFNRIVLTPVDNGAGEATSNNSDFVLLSVQVLEPAGAEDFTYTLRDVDGDESSATLHIGFDEAGPIAGAPLDILVDEDGLNPAGALTDGVGDNAAGDAEEAHGGLNAAKDDAAFVGNIAFTPGADPVTLELTVEGGDTGLTTLAGKAILAAWDPEEHELVGFVAGTDPSDVVNRIFVMEITDDETGAFTFSLLQPVKHPAGDGENALDPSFTVDVQIGDSGGNTAFTQVKVTIDDDSPVARGDEDGVASDGAADGNVISGLDTTSGAPGADSPGADGAAVSQVLGKNGATADADFDLNGFLQVAGDHGTLSIKADGSYHYEQETGTDGDTDSFAYTLKDGDGDLSTATLTITLTDLFGDVSLARGQAVFADFASVDSLANVTQRLTGETQT